jgi:hypothetical protein
MKKEGLEKCVKMDVCRGIGEAMARATKYEMELTTNDMLEALDFIDFAKLYDFRMKTLNKFDDPGLVRTIKFTSDGKEKEIRFKLDKRVGRIDFVTLDKSEVKLEELLELIYFHPEVNALFQKLIEETDNYVFSQCKVTKKGHSEIGYYSNDKIRSTEVSCLAQTEKNGTITKFGNKGRVLLKLLFEFGKYLEITGYSMLRPTNKEQKAYYEVETMRAYYHKL